MPLTKTKWNKSDEWFNESAMTTTLTPVAARKSEVHKHVGDTHIEVVPYHVRTPTRTVTRGVSELQFGECVTVFFAGVLFLLTLPFSLFFCLRTVKEYQRAVVFRLGKIRSRQLRGPGLIFVLVCVDEVRIIDVRMITLDVSPQTTLTKDSVTATIDSVVYYCICDPITACTNVKNVTNSTKLLAMISLRNVVGTKNLSEVLTDRETISLTIKQELDNATEDWGVRIDRVEITDIRLPEQLQKAMAAEAEAIRESRAKVISAEGELKAAKALKDASDIMRENPLSLQLRYLQTLNNVACNKTSTIIFPVPSDMFRKQH